MKTRRYADQIAIVAAIERLYAERDELPLTMRELQLAMGMSTTSAVIYQVRMLSERGYIRYTPGVARSIRPARRAA